MNVLVSVIVPVYYSKNTLERCVESILEQTVSDFQLILVNDASPDGSGAICDMLSGKDSRITVIHKKKNEGAAAARYTGLDAASGKYVIFCDSDDAVAPKWLEHLLAFARDGILPMCSYCHSREELGKEKELNIPGREYRAVSEYFRFNRNGIAGFLWNALYSNEVIQKNHLRLRVQTEKGDYNEDLLFALQYVRYMKQIAYVGYGDYLYDVHEGSLSTSYRTLYFEKYEEKYRLWKAFLEETGQFGQLKELATMMLYHFLKALNYEKFKGFVRVVRSDAVQDCVAAADTCGENPGIIRLIKNKAAFTLWLRYRLHALKG